MTVMKEASISEVKAPLLETSKRLWGDENAGLAASSLVDMLHSKHHPYFAFGRTMNGLASLCMRLNVGEHSLNGGTMAQMLDTMGVASDVIQGPTLDPAFEVGRLVAYEELRATVQGASEPGEDLWSEIDAIIKMRAELQLKEGGPVAWPDRRPTETIFGGSLIYGGWLHEVTYESLAASTVRNLGDMTGRCKQYTLQAALETLGHE